MNSNTIPYIQIHVLKEYDRKVCRIQRIDKLSIKLFKASKSRLPRGLRSFPGHAIFENKMFASS